MKTITKMLSIAAMGLGLLVAIPGTARADDSFRVNLNLGGGGYYQPAPVVERVVYRDVYSRGPVQRVVVREYPRTAYYRPMNVVRYGYPVRREHWHRERCDHDRGYHGGRHY